MNGWIETQNPGVFADVGRDDIILRSSTISGSVVVGNSSKLVGGLYVRDNNVGIRGLPLDGVALTVSGDLVVNVANGDSMSFTSQGLDIGFSNSNALSITRESLSMTSPCMKPETWPARLNYDGSASADTILAKTLLKISKKLI